MNEQLLRELVVAQQEEIAQLKQANKNDLATFSSQISENKEKYEKEVEQWKSLYTAQEKELAAAREILEEFRRNHPQSIQPPSSSKIQYRTQSDVEYGIACALPVNRDDEEHIRRKDQWETDPTGEWYVPGYFEAKVRMGNGPREEKVVREAFSLIRDNPASFTGQTVRIVCYQGTLSDPKWLDEDEAFFSLVCTIHVDLNEAIKDLVMDWDDFGDLYYQLDYDMIITFGHTDIRAEVCWISETGEQRVPARITYGDTTTLSEELNVLKRRDYEVDQVLKRKQFNDAPSVSTGGLGCTVKPEKSGISSACLPGQDAPAEAGLGPAVTPSVTQTRLLGGGEAVSLTSGITLAVTNVVNKVRDMFHVVFVGVASDGVVPTVLPPSPWAPRQVMPRSYIQNILHRAIKAGHERRPPPYDDRVDVIKNFNGGYCDAESAGDLRLVGETGNVQVWVGQGVLNVDTFMERMHEPLTLFVRTVAPIAALYRLPADSVRVFYDVSAGCIAFNCKGVLYLNLRYFEAWHYQDVKKGDAHRAMSSWFLTLAHEIAHNLTMEHNSEHAFWFSAICEAHIKEFSQLLASGAPSV